MTLFEALLLQNELQCKYTGGTVLHLYMREKISTLKHAEIWLKSNIKFQFTLYHYHTCI